MSEQEEGKWAIAGLSGVVGVHAALMGADQVLFFCRPEYHSHRHATPPNPNGLVGDDDPVPERPDRTLSAVFPLEGAHRYQPIESPVEYNPFCSGHVHLADGRLLVAGGDKRANSGGGGPWEFERAPTGTRFGLQALQVFTALDPREPFARGWAAIGEISDSRWYPTCTLLPDGRVFIVSGSIDDQDIFPNLNPTCELPPPLAGGPQVLPLLFEAWPYHSYPFVCVLPTGDLFLFARVTAYFLKLIREASGQERFVVTRGPSLNRAPPGDAREPAKQYPNNGSAVLLPLRPSDGYRAEVLMVGGAGGNLYDIWGDKAHYNGATVDCWRLLADPSDPASAWREAAPMPHARVMPDTVLLPDGTVLVVNGACRGYAGGTATTGPAIPRDAIKVADLYDPVADRWTSLAAATCERLYHSTALLLPDATVLVAGNDHRVPAIRAPEPGSRPCSGGDEERISEALIDTGLKLLAPATVQELARTFEFRVEIFSPPYLLTGKPRPVIEEAPDRVSYGSLFAIRVGGLLSGEPGALACALIRPGSVTHTNNMTQRYIELRVIGFEEQRLSIEAPPDENVAPPGDYMLFVLYEGIPSTAAFVRLPLRPGGRAPDARVPRQGCVAWLRADSGVLADSTANVHTWADLSDAGNDLRWVGSDDEARLASPAKLDANGPNREPAIRFSLVSSSRFVDPGTGNANLDMRGGLLRSVRDSFLPGSGPYDVYVVTHLWPGGPVGLGGLLGWGDFTPTRDNACVALRTGLGPLDNKLPLQPGRASIETYWTAVRDTATALGMHEAATAERPLATMMRPILVHASYDGERTLLQVDGRLIADEPASGKATGPGPLVVGATGFFEPGNDQREYFRGDIAEILVFNRPLEVQERGELQAYLVERYGLERPTARPPAASSAGSSVVARPPNV